MIQLLRSLLVSRSVAAAVGLLTSTAALMLLPGSEYATASVAISITAVATIAFYFPFSKYVLVTGDPSEIEVVFWRLQGAVAILLLSVVIVWCALDRSQSLTLAISGVIFAISQGWKEFCGETIRVRRQLQSLRRLYVNDSITTAITTVVMLYLLPRAEVFLLCSASSSLWWSWCLSERSATSNERRPWSQLLGEVYRYSYGIVGTSSINAATLASARALVMRASPAEYVGIVQFMLDFLQKPMALLASSLTSAAVPESRTVNTGRLMTQLQVLMGVGLGALALLAVVLQLTVEARSPSGQSFSLSLAMACALLIWANRFKTTVMDFPLVCSRSHVSDLLYGAIVGFLAIHALARFGTTLHLALWLSTLAIFLGGLTSQVVSQIRKLTSFWRTLSVCALPLCAVAMGFLFGSFT